MKKITTKNKAYVIVGHSNWGKTSTLRSLCGIVTPRPGPYPPLALNNEKIPIISMSNDDIRGKLLDRIKRKTQTRIERFIFALCPDFRNPNKHTEDIIKLCLTEGYELYFWVIERQQKPGTNRVITITEIDNLKKYGVVEVFSAIALNQQSVLGAEFKKFIIKHF